MPLMHTHWLALKAPVPLVVCPTGHGLHMAWFAKLAYVPSAHFSQMLSPTSRYPNKQEHFSNSPVDSSTPTFTILLCEQLQLLMPTDLLADTLRKGQFPQLTDP
jgi:hypothetical protein